MQVLEKAPLTNSRKIASTAYATNFVETGYRDYLNTIPFVNIVESSETYQIKVAAPGMKKEDFSIEVKGNTMIISCESSLDDELADEVNYARNEFNYSSFYRTFTLPENVNRDMLMSQYKDGILKVNLPKKPGYSNN